MGSRGWNIPNISQALTLCFSWHINLLPNSRFPKYPSPAFDWKIWKAFGWHFSDLLVTFKWYFGGLVVTIWWPFSDLSVTFCDRSVAFRLGFCGLFCLWVTFWWPFGGLLVAFQWFFNDLSMTFWWPFGDVSVAFVYFIEFPYFLIEFLKDQAFFDIPFLS